jgi:hypothetical protein
MKRCLFVICASLLLIVGLYVTTTTAANAATVSPQQNISHITARQIANGISLLKAHIHFDTQKRASLDVSNASSVGLDEQTFVLFEQGIQQYNTALSKGLIKASPISTSTQTKTTSSSVRPYTCAGTSAFYFNAKTGDWTIYVNECMTVQIEAALGIAAGVVGIAGIIAELIPGGQAIGAALGIASFLIAIGAATILLTDAGGGFNGIYMVGTLTRGQVSVKAFGAQ